LQLEDVEVVAGAGAVPFNRKRFGGQLTQDITVGPKGARGVRGKSVSPKKK
jgi:hypothetical protein